jgi:ESCRT-I complex subunit TSG101
MGEQITSLKGFHMITCYLSRLLNAFAEEAATEDAIYYMGEALRRGVIDLDVFLKQIRSLSRKQFMLRALMHKCRQKAGLAG